MLLDLLKKAIQFFSGMSNDAKLLFVVMVILMFHTNLQNMNNVETLLERERIEKIQAEKYTEKVTPLIKTQLRYMLMSDPSASNVILLSYHNSNHSSQGFSYKYITYLTEEPRDEEPLHEEDFKELSYVSYGEEFARIHNVKYLKADNVEMLRNTYPKLYRKIKNSDAKAVVFFPIEGVMQPVGMVVVLYNKTLPSYDLGFYTRNFSPRIQRLAILLDYNNFKKELAN